ncbi:stage II sporulation protein AA (anti-sigma F factor antagonist) [Variovorax sp. OK605]|jgi:anti-anti-sigma factor|uniref:STAS domain-containing protein n=1 Tax=unclassified Variovorax TaxID=663243 RepID=UPI0008D8B773|nr:MULTISPECIES: STAS domain-containing protein [unclassified Variovorax]SEK10252.1 anti-sigma B factor antagonist/stage II sporulation protein AA (anti-sigma F factor antagonist) [Variovorax sp. OK202]SFD67049.1 anti-sigma B factor antagonist/stage II sporulation protein AA (anti-sigma F factor antagonist) [Variovorax sp. OK212]SFQ11699.1 stage II sporulation protein AA (anti-sigma F factor antagonist) [Variovorax sp. OK605]
MNIEQETRGDVLVVRLAGRLDSSSAPELERMLLEQFTAGLKRLVFDFSALDYVSSAGLRVILLAGKKLRAAQGKLALVGLRDMVREVFEMSGFLTLFAVTDTVDEGVAKV